MVTEKFYTNFFCHLLQVTALIAYISLTMVVRFGYSIYLDAQYIVLCCLCVVAYASYPWHAGFSHVYQLPFHCYGLVPLVSQHSIWFWLPTVSISQTSFYYTVVKFVVSWL